MTNLKDMAEVGASLTGLTAREVCAWWYAENGVNWPTTNNPGNVSYQGKGIPSGGVFTGVTEVLANKVCVYATPEDGVQAWAELLKAPDAEHGGVKALTLDLQTLLASKSVEEFASLIGNSNWSESHYDDGKGPGSLILDAYHNSVISEWFAAPASNPQPVDKPVDKSTSAVTDTEIGIVHHTHIVVSGDTLSRIAANNHVPVGVLARLNAIANPDVIEVGEVIHLPQVYKIRPGDDLVKICSATKVKAATLEHVNAWNPDRIVPGDVLFF